MTSYPLFLSLYPKNLDIVFFLYFFYIILDSQHTSTSSMAARVDPHNSEDINNLPSGFEARRDLNGRIYFVNHIKK